MKTEKTFAKSLVLLALALLVLFGSRIYDPRPSEAAAVAAKPAMQLQHPWTAVASTAAIDESSLFSYAFEKPHLTFASGVTTTSLIAHYNVTNTYDNSPSPSNPGWSTLEMGSSAPPGSTVTARLWEVDKCTAARTLICTATNSGGGDPVCSYCSFGLGSVDFADNLYYVEVTLTRASATVFPRLHTLRIY